jgi:hypothetical protein
MNTGSSAEQIVRSANECTRQLELLDDALGRCLSELAGFLKDNWQPKDLS